MSLEMNSTPHRTRAVRDGHDWHIFCEGDHRRLSLRQELAEVEDARAGSLANGSAA